MRYVAEIGTGSSPDWGIAKVKDGNHCYFVEPNPHQFLKLQKAVKDLAPDLVTLCNFAVTSVARLVWFNAFDDLPNASYLQTVMSKHRTPGEMEDGQSISKFLINAMPINDFLSIKQFEEIRMDIEGSEGFIFDTVMKGKLPNIMHIEFHSGVGETVTRNRLHNFGYTIENVDKTHKTRPLYTFRRD